MHLFIYIFVTNAMKTMTDSILDELVQ